MTVQFGLGGLTCQAPSGTRGAYGSALREAVEGIAHNPAYRERMQQMQQVTRAGGGYQRAADAIIQFTQVLAQT